MLLILGDVGLKLQDTKENEEFTEHFLSEKCPIAIVDGNHENFDYLYSFPIEEWNGGKVHRLTENIVHLMRGNIFEIEEKSFLVFGGCRSSERWKTEGRWFPQEEATAEEYESAYKNFKKYNNKVDYIITHKYGYDPTDPYLVEDFFKLTNYIDEKVEFSHWYSGHCHINHNIDNRHTNVYDIPIIIK